MRKVTGAPIYRFEYGAQGIYEAVDLHCSRQDTRRDVKPDGSWLAKAGKSFSGAVSYWTAAGLDRYIRSGLQDWHRAVLPGEPRVKVSALQGPAQYSDEFQVIAEPTRFANEKEMATSEFFLEKSRGDFVEKVAAYVVRDGLGGPELLVFRHRNHPEAGVQFPAGTVEPNEPLEAAVKRELFEESGLVLDSDPVFLGTWVFFKNYSSQFQRRHVYLFRINAKLPENWCHIVSAAGVENGLELEYEWQSLGKLDPNLLKIEGMGDSLIRIQR